jgi:hypothetical protein
LAWGRAHAAEISMRHSWILLSILPLAACATQPAAAPAAAVPAEDAAFLGSQAEADAAQREREFLAAMAREGVYPLKEPAQATVKYHQQDVLFGLYNEAYTAQSEYYTIPRTSANFKVVDNIDMGALWKSLEDSGFFKLAQKGVVRMPGASVSVVMRRGEEAWTLAWAPTMDKQRYEQTMQCANAVSALFNGTFGLQVIDNPGGVEFFEQERERLRDNANKTQGPGGGQ